MAGKFAGDFWFADFRASFAAFGHPLEGGWGDLEGTAVWKNFQHCGRRGKARARALTTEARRHGGKSTSVGNTRITMTRVADEERDGLSNAQS